MNLKHLSNFSFYFKTTASPPKVQYANIHRYFPEDILLEISQHCSGRKDILNLAFTCNANYKCLIPVLFADMDIIGYNLCNEVTHLLCDRPDLASYVKRLVLHPSHVISSIKGALKQEKKIIGRLKQMVPHLLSLQTFLWDGLECPDDSIWGTLRSNCPQLNYVGTTIGKQFIKDDSLLFDFSDLIGFSLTSKQHPLGWMSTGTPVKSLPDAMWRMLHNRCPLLEELSIGTIGSAPSDQVFDVRPLIQGRWPRLHSLSIGNTEIQNYKIPKNVLAAIHKEFNDFISAHPLLKQFHIPSYTKIPRIGSAGSNMKIESFSGDFRDLHDLLPACNLKELILCTRTHSAEDTSCVRQILGGLHALTSLTIWIDLSDRLENDMHEVEEDAKGTDHLEIFRSILAVCPGLEYFKVLCSTKSKYSFSMNDLPKALAVAPKLKSLEVHKVHILGEEDMIQTAMQLAQQLPGLERVCLRVSATRWTSSEPMLLRQIGTYQILRDDTTGEGTQLLADEFGAGYFLRFKRKYKQKL